MVYSATDGFDDGGLLYYPHSSYAIYTTNGKLVKSVEIKFHAAMNSRGRSAAGWIVHCRRAAKGGNVRVHVVIKAGHRTTLDLDSREENSLVTELSSARSKGAQRQNQAPGAGAVQRRFWE